MIIYSLYDDDYVCNLFVIPILLVRRRCGHRQRHHSARGGGSPGSRRRWRLTTTTTGWWQTKSCEKKRKKKKKKKKTAGSNMLGCYETGGLSSIVITSGLFLVLSRGSPTPMGCWAPRSRSGEAGSYHRNRPQLAPRSHVGEGRELLTTGSTMTIRQRFAELSEVHALGVGAFGLVTFQQERHAEAHLRTQRNQKMPRGCCLLQLERSS